MPISSTPGKLQMSINPTLPPQQFVDEKGELQGLNVELMREIAKRLCVPLDLMRMDFPPMIPALQGGRFDGINTGMFWTEERSKIAYTVPYAQQTISLTVVKGSPLKLTDVAAMAGRKAGVEVNSYQERWLRAVDKEATAKGAKPIEILTFKTATDVLAACALGQVETAIMIDQTAREIERRGLVEITATGLGGAPTDDDVPQPQRRREGRGHAHGDEGRRQLRQAVRQVRADQGARQRVRHPRPRPGLGIAG